MTIAAQPAAWKTFGEAPHSGVLMVNGSRVYDLPSDQRVDLDAGKMSAQELIEPFSETARPLDLDVPAPPSPQNISLNVSSSCNLSCAYCYAGKGGFDGAQTLHMKWPVAKAAIDRLLETAEPAAPVTIGFIGGEPFVNPKLIHKSVAYAAEQGRLRGLDVRFSVTTNGSLLKPDDIKLMQSHRFAVTFSIDGGAERHEMQRPGADFAHIAGRAGLLLANPGSAQIAARATVTRGAFDLTERFDAIQDIGFTDIGFSPVRMGAKGQKFEAQDWEHYLAAVIALADREIEKLGTTGKTAFSNFMIALKKIHGGACSPYPCGAGGGYFSVAADGDWYACHRAIGNDRFLMGNSEQLDPQRRSQFLEERHIDAQTDCQTCWARYLCSGACHQEQSARSPESCDFIRGWLEYCLEAYLRISRTVKL